RISPLDDRASRPRAVPRERAAGGKWHARRVAGVRSELRAFGRSVRARAGELVSTTIDREELDDRDDVTVALEGHEPDPVMQVLRRGLAATPELREGFPVTALLAIIGGGGRIVVPVLVQQVLDKGLANGVQMDLVIRLCAIAAVIVVISAIAVRLTHVRLS